MIEVNDRAFSGPSLIFLGEVLMCRLLANVMELQKMLQAVGTGKTFLSDLGSILTITKNHLLL